MTEKKQDARVRYTKMMIRSSFIALLREKPLSRVTVTEICEAAGINRATFYAHYRDPADLLASIETEVMEKIGDVLLPLAGATGGDLRDTIAQVFRFIRENTDVCSVLLSERGESAFLEQVVSLLEKQFIAAWTSGRGLSQEDAHTIFSFAAIGSVGLLRQWLLGGMKRTPEEMADLIIKLTWRGFSAF